MTEKGRGAVPAVQKTKWKWGVFSATITSRHFHPRKNSAHRDAAPETRAEGAHMPGDSPIRDRATRLVFIANAIDLGGAYLSIAVIPYYVQELGGSGTTVGAVQGTFAACQMVSQLWSGPASDKYGRRMMLVVSLAGVCIGQCFSSVAPMWQLFVVARGLVGLFAGAGNVVNAYVADITPSEEQPAMLMKLGMMNGLAFTLSPPLGTFIAVHAGYQMVFVVSAVTTLIASVYVALMLPNVEDVVTDSSEPKSPQSPPPQSPPRWMIPPTPQSSAADGATISAVPLAAAEPADALVMKALSRRASSTAAIQLAGDEAALSVDRQLSALEKPAASKAAPGAAPCQIAMVGLCMGLGMASLAPLLSTSALWLQRYLGWDVGVFGQLLLTSNLVMMLGVALTFEKLTTRSHRQHLHLTSPTSRTAAHPPPPRPHTHPCAGSGSRRSEPSRGWWRVSPIWYGRASLTIARCH